MNRRTFAPYRHDEQPAPYGHARRIKGSELAAPAQRVEKDDEEEEEKKTAAET